MPQFNKPCPDLINRCPDLINRPDDALPAEIYPRPPLHPPDPGVDSWGGLKGKGAVASQDHPFNKQTNAHMHLPHVHATVRHVHARIHAFPASERV